jgi:Tfp pilus assembly protein PilF
LYGLNGDLKNCIIHLHTATVKDPKFTDAFYNLAVAMEQQGDLQDAYKTYQRVLKLEKTHREAKSNVFQLKRRLHIV